MRCHTWLPLLAYEARVRHEDERRRQHAAAARLSLARCRLMAELRLAILLDLEGFLSSSDGAAASLTLGPGETIHGWTVSLANGGGEARTLSVDRAGDALDCRYAGDQAEARQLTFDMPAHPAHERAAFSLWADGREHRLSVDRVSALLLAPLFEP